MRVLIYAPVDLNLIDGSAIWCASVAQMLACDPAIYVDILLNCPLSRDINVRSLTDHGRVGLVDPWTLSDEVHPHKITGATLGHRLRPETAFSLIEALQRHRGYDLLILRGGPISRLVASVPWLAARSWFYLTQHDAVPETMASLVRCNGRIACQTPMVQEYIEQLIGPNPDRYVPLPPMVPRSFCEQPRAARAHRRLCYVGKFDPRYMVEEMLAAFGALRERIGDAEFIIAGDKFHDLAHTGQFQARLTRLLDTTPAVVWHGGLSRDRVGDLMTSCDVGSCWRSPEFDTSLELSTKVLEYGAAGLPTILNPSRVNLDLFGPDYPLYVHCAESFVDRLTAAFEDNEVYRRAADTAFEVSKKFTFEAVLENLQPWLRDYRRARDDRRMSASTSRLPGTVPHRRPLRIVFAGHDLRFAREIMDHFTAHPDCLVRTDKWHGHNRHDERRSEWLVQWADVVHCEWCLGNAVWYSERLRAGQRLVIRLHLQERDTDYPGRVAWDNVSDLIFIAPHVRREVLDRLGPQVVCRSHLIYNIANSDCFGRPKPAGCERNLGLLGLSPKRKHPQLSLDILSALLAEDSQWRLHLGGKDPREHDWLWRRLEERAYYEQMEERIAAAEKYIVRQGWTDDPSSWYAPIGFVLSCSDFEGSHQAIPEGMAAGCVPVVRRWEGASEMYPNSLLYDTVDEAVEKIKRVCDSGERQHLAEHAKREARERFHKSVILPQLEPLLFGTEPSPREKAAEKRLVASY
ncbi:MAG: glycosyltransferase family 4 protein [Phycisphaerae bacterium]|nr:glycosyltransferase family 4 protein [Phycisphaerae bacterium]